jgi:hypothetical protein
VAAHGCSPSSTRMACGEPILFHAPHLAVPQQPPYTPPLYSSPRSGWCSRRACVWHGCTWHSQTGRRWDRCYARCRTRWRAQAARRAGTTARGRRRCVGCGRLHAPFTKLSRSHCQTVTRVLVTAPCPAPPLSATGGAGAGGVCAAHQHAGRAGRLEAHGGHAQGEWRRVERGATHGCGMPQVANDGGSVCYCSLRELISRRSPRISLPLQRALQAVQTAVPHPSITGIIHECVRRRRRCC